MTAISTSSVRSSAEPGAGQSRANPAPERALLKEEGSLVGPTGYRFTRVIAMFTVLIDGKAKPIDKRQLEEQNFDGVEILGLVATLVARAGLFAQCCWFDPREVDRMWVILKDIRSMYPRCDLRFRAGRCFWIGTEVGDYAVTLPHTSYNDQWDITLKHVGQDGALLRIYRWPCLGLYPPWWPEQWRDAWPNPVPTVTPADKKNTPTSNDQPSSSHASKVARSRKRPRLEWLRPPQELQPPTPTLTPHIANRVPWSLKPDEGTIVPDPERQARPRPGKHVTIRRR